MPALTYEDLGSISGVTTDPKTVAGSVRSRDRNDKQRLAFQADPNRPFTGTVHIQAAVGDPNNDSADTIWFNIVEMVINNEGGVWSFEPEGEFSSLRVVCSAGNYWSSAQGTDGATVAPNPTPAEFTIDGISVTVPGGSNAATIAAAINLIPAITALSVVADVVDGASLRIYKTDGTDLVLADVVDTPLADMGITTGTTRGGVISKIRMLR